MIQAVSREYRLRLPSILFMSRTNSECVLASKAAEDRRTPRRGRVGLSRSTIRQVLECAAPVALWISLAGPWSQCTAKMAWGLSVSVILLDSAAVRSEEPDVKLGHDGAIRYCQTCHLLPKPELLDKETWVREALPHMAPWLGVAKLDLASRPDGQRLAASGVLPPAPMLSEKEWRAIHAYYGSVAPTEPLTPTNKPAAKVGLPLFRPRTLRTTTNVPFTSLVRMDVANKRLYVGDAQEKTLKVLQPDGALLHSIKVDSAPVSVSFQRTNLIVTLIGRTFPSDELAGQVWSVSFTNGAPVVKRLLRGLPRATHTAVADLNRDGRDDLIVCGFGNSLGKLSWFENQGEGKYAEHVLLNGSGAIQSFVHDWDGDGRPDVAVLRGQAREGVEILYNRETKFEEIPVIQLPPSYGCASWQVLDFDGDGHLDLLIANGDNGDYKSKPKAYHGIRLFRGDGRGHFTERWFHPLNGAYGVYAADFDADGDLDIAAISYFLDCEKYPDEGFVYLRNDGDWHFQPFVLPAARHGRWLVMDAGDIDGDGDLDIALGSFPQGPRTTFIPDERWRDWETNRISVMILENTSR